MSIKHVAGSMVKEHGHLGNIQKRARVHCASAFPGLWLKAYGVSSVLAIVSNSPSSKATK